MKIKAIYRKNLKMSEGKVAAQVAHAVKNLGVTPVDSDIIVLRVSDKKFNELISEHQCFIQIDKGLTEIEKGTATAAAWIDSHVVECSIEFDGCKDTSHFPNCGDCVYLNVTKK